MKRAYPVYLLALGAALLSGCSDKEDAPLVLTGTYESGPTILAANPIEMYTRNGLVNNPALVDKFLTRLRLTSYFSRVDVPMTSGTALHLTIDATGQARYFSTYPGQLRIDTIKATVTSQLSQYFVLADNDSIANYISSSSGGSSGASSFCSALAEKIKVEYPGRRCVDVPPVTGYSRYCRVRPLRVVELKGQELFVPLMSWVVSNNQLPFASCTSGMSGEWNLFNRAIINQLAAGDTIVVQIRNIALLKK